jgi:predicted HicB family RNase H-like nuclease
MNIMKLNGYKATIEYDPELDMFRGEILNLNGGADFYGQNPDELREEFKNSLEVFLEVCKEKGISPTKDFGNFNVKIPPDLHRKIAKQAKIEGINVNQWITDKISQILQHT